MDKEIDLFISYSSEDKEIATELCDYLEKNRVKCWIAPRDVRAGYLYGAEIVNALKTCQAMILVYSGNSNISKHVANEIDVAFNKDKIIIPFRIEDTPLCDSFEYYLSNKHWINASKNPRSYFEFVLNQFEALIGGEKRSGYSANAKQKQSGNTIHSSERKSFDEPVNKHSPTQRSLGSNIGIRVAGFKICCPFCEEEVYLEGDGEQMCPSCDETFTLINGTLIGKKILCPYCLEEVYMEGDVEQLCPSCDETFSTKNGKPVGKKMMCPYCEEEVYLEGEGQKECPFCNETFSIKNGKPIGNKITCPYCEEEVYLEGTGRKACPSCDEYFTIR